MRGEIFIWPDDGGGGGDGGGVGPQSGSVRLQHKSLLVVGQTNFCRDESPTNQLATKNYKSYFVLRFNNTLMNVRL